MEEIQVWRVQTWNTNPKDYGVPQDEKWKLVKDRIFYSLKDAERYVISRNQYWCGVDLNIFGESDDNVIRKRCLTDDQYLSLRRFFIGKPDVDLIKRQLKDHHIQVLSV